MKKVILLFIVAIILGLIGGQVGEADTLLPDRNTPTSFQSPLSARNKLFLPSIFNE